MSLQRDLNIIVIIADTFRADHLGCYGIRRVKTPNLDRLAQDSVVFTNVTTEGLPTIPCRRVYHTGKSVLPESKWQPLAPGDTTFAEIAGRHGVTSGFIVDTYHHFKPDYNFHRGFDSWQWIRSTRRTSCGTSRTWQDNCGANWKSTWGSRYRRCRCEPDFGRLCSFHGRL